MAGAQSHPAWRDLSLPTVRACSTAAEVNFSCILSFEPLTPALCPQTEVASRVLAVCKAFDKIAADQLNVDSHFIKVGYLGS